MTPQGIASVSECLSTGVLQACRRCGGVGRVYDGTGGGVVSGVGAGAGAVVVRKSRVMVGG